MRTAPTSPVKCLKVEEWPIQDQVAWHAAVARGDRLDDAGLFANLRGTTVHARATAYGRWLWFLISTERSDLDDEPELRITPENVRAFVEDLNSRNAPLTAAHRVLCLERVAKAFAPKSDWRWLRRLVNKLYARAKPVRDKRGLLRPPAEMMSLGFSLMQRAEEGVDLTRRRQALLYRDALLLSILASRAPRGSNLCMLELSKHLCRIGRCWRLVFEPQEMKNDSTFEIDLPAELTPCMDRYLSYWRPLLLGNKRTERVWVAATGEPLCADQLHFVITRLTKRVLGIAINPHSLRHGLATGAAIQAPGGVGMASAILHHCAPTSSNRYYNLAGQHEVAREWQRHVLNLRRKARRG